MAEATVVHDASSLSASPGGRSGGAGEPSSVAEVGAAFASVFRSAADPAAFPALPPPDEEEAVAKVESSLGDKLVKRAVSFQPTETETVAERGFLRRKSRSSFDLDSVGMSSTWSARSGGVSVSMREGGWDDGDEEQSPVILAIKRHPLFRGVRRRFVDALLHLSKTREVSPGEEVDIDGEERLLIVDRGGLQLRIACPGSEGSGGGGQASLTPTPSHTALGAGAGLLGAAAAGTQMRLGTPSAHPPAPSMALMGPGAMVNVLGFTDLQVAAQAFKPRRRTLKDDEAGGPVGARKGAVRNAIGYDPVLPEAGTGTGKASFKRVDSIGRRRKSSLGSTSALGEDSPEDAVAMAAKGRGGGQRRRRQSEERSYTPFPAPITGSDDAFANGGNGGSVAEITDSELCFYAACPYGAHRQLPWQKPCFLGFELQGRPAVSEEAQDEDPSTGRGSGAATAAEEHEKGEEEEERPSRALEAEAEATPDGGARLVLIPNIDNLLAYRHNATAEKAWGLPQAELLTSLERLEANRAKLEATWRMLMKALLGTCMPAAPPEVVMALAARAETIEIASGGLLAHEGDEGDEGDAVLVLAEGFCTVTRKVAARGRGLPSTQEVVGRLRPGTVIGDICLVGVGVPRPATVQARTDVKVIKISVPHMLEIFEAFPGCLQGIEPRLYEAADYLKSWLPTRMEAVRALKLFSDFDLAFLTTLSQMGERKAMTFGQVVIEGGITNETMYILEVGRCAVERDGQRLAFVPVGDCFGERTLLGIDRATNASVRVVTPLALLLTFSRPSLQTAMAAHPEASKAIEKLKHMPVEGRVTGNVLKNMELFADCGAAFLADLARVAEIRGYLPAQAIIVQGDAEVDPRMFMLTGGKLAVESTGGQLVKLPHGAAFGELVMLGKVDRNAITVRATTFCFILSIHRSDFFEVLDRHGEQRDVIFSRFQGQVEWPCFQDVDTRLLHLLRLHADRAAIPAGLECNYSSENTAVLVESGKAVVVDREGNELCSLLPGRCWNEQTLVGAPRITNQRLIARTQCAVSLLTQTQLARASAEFPEEGEAIRRAVLRHIAERAEADLGYEPGGTESLRKVSAFFGSASDEFLQVVREQAEPRFYEPGAIIGGRMEMCEDPCGTHMILPLKGEATLEDPFETVAQPLGVGFGEAVMLGITHRYPGALRAVTLCVVLAFKQKSLDEALEEFTEERERLDRLREEARNVDFRLIRTMLLRSPAFQAMPRDVFSALCPRNNVRIFGPGDPIFESGDGCELGKTPFFVLLAGKVVVEGAEGTVLGTVSRGAVIGEIAAWGLVGKRTATCRAARGTEQLVACAQINGAAIKATVESNPCALRVLRAYHERQQQANKVAEEKRHSWLDDVVVPALSRTWLFSGCPKKFLHDVAVSIADGVTFQPGDIVRRMGEPSAGMLLMLSGAAELLSGSGAVAGQIMEGGCFGEVCTLGIFGTCIATIRALTECCVCEVPKDGLLEATGGSKESEQIAKTLERLALARSEQAATGMPLCALPFGVQQEDVSARVVALLSHRISLRAGKVWQPARHDSVLGQYILIVTSGQAALVIGNESQLVMSLPHGTVFGEGEMVQYGGRLKAVSACDVYRIRRAEFNLSIEQDPAAKNWIWGFRLKEKEVAERIRRQLTNAQGLIQSKEGHELDSQIHDLVARRQVRIKNADRIRKDVHDPPALEHQRRTGATSVTLPLIPSVGGQSSSPTASATATPASAALSQMSTPAAAAAHALLCRGGGGSAPDLRVEAARHQRSSRQQHPQRQPAIMTTPSVASGARRRRGGGSPLGASPVAAVPHAIEVEYAEDDELGWDATAEHRCSFSASAFANSVARGGHTGGRSLDASQSEPMLHLPPVSPAGAPQRPAPAAMLG